MTFRLAALTGGLAAMLCVGCAFRNEDLSTGKDLYSFQKELEAKLKGTPQERERLAALLPLRILLAKHANDGGVPGVTCDGKEGLEGYHDYRVLVYIEKNNVREAVPMLERALHRGNKLYSDIRYRNGVARIWLRMKTQDMSRKEKARFAVSLLEPSGTLDAGGEAYDLLLSLGADGKAAVVGMLTQNRKKMGPRDGMLAGFPAGLLGEPGFRPTPDEVSRMLRNGSGFTKVAMCLYLADKGDPRALKLLNQLWDEYPADHPSLARKAPLGTYSIGAIDGAAPVLLKLLRKLDTEKTSLRTSSDRSSVLACIMNTRARAKSAELARYLTAYTARKLPDLAEYGKLPARETLGTLYTEAAAHTFAQRILDMWARQADEK